MGSRDSEIGECPPVPNCFGGFTGGPFEPQSIVRRSEKYFQSKEKRRPVNRKLTFIDKKYTKRQYNELRPLYMRDKPTIKTITFCVRTI